MSLRVCEELDRHPNPRSADTSFDRIAAIPAPG